MSDPLTKVEEWLKTFPQYAAISEYHVDYTDKIPGNGGIFPSGLTEVSRTEDILGNVTVRDQYNFGLYYVFVKSEDDDISKENAGWVNDLQLWVQSQSAAHTAPTFGDEPDRETITAQNGALYGVDDEGTAMYMVQLTAQFIKHYEVI